MPICRECENLYDAQEGIFDYGGQVYVGNDLGISEQNKVIIEFRHVCKKCGIKLSTGATVLMALFEHIAPLFMRRPLGDESKKEILKEYANIGKRALGRLCGELPEPAPTLSPERVSEAEQAISYLSNITVNWDNEPDSGPDRNPE